MPRRLPFVLTAGFAVFAGAALTFGDARETYMQWEVHDMSRPKPAVVVAGEGSTSETVGSAPSDAVVLFDGTGTDAFRHGEGDCKWAVVDDLLEVVPGTGDAHSRQAFGDCQIHIEWMVGHDMPDREGQSRGNSGIFIMNQYEVQILDIYENESYADGMAGGIYGQTPALVNPCRPRGEWNIYDIIFHRPHFDDEGNCTTPATVTVLFNGVLVQDHTEILGPTRHHARTEYHAHADAMPFRLQDHGDKMRFRNIWVRELE